MSESIDRILFACEQLTTGKCPRNPLMNDENAIDIFDCYAEPRTHWERNIDDKDLAIKIMSKCIVKLANEPKYKSEVDRLRSRIAMDTRNHDDVKRRNKEYKKRIKELEEQLNDYLQK